MSKPGSKPAPAAPKTAAAATKIAPVSAPKSVSADLGDAAKPAAAEVKVPLAKMRGPRGVAETAKITLLVPQNPKRAGSKAFAVFACYKEGMTVGAFCDAVDATENKGAATPNLVYDSAHKFIEIEGYTPAAFFEAKPKAAPKVVVPGAPKATKAAAAPKTAAETKEQAESHAAEVGEATETETME